MPVHLIIATHTTRHLEAVLKGASLLSPRADTISLTCDVSDPEISNLTTTSAQLFGIEILYTQRKHHGIARPAQTRNNALRALMDHGHTSGLLVFLDGDMILCPGALNRHLELAKTYAVIAGERLNLTEEETPEFSRNLIKKNGYATIHAPEEMKRLKRVDRKRKEHLFFRRFGLAKPMKPKITGCHFSFRFEELIKLNGFDERFMGYGAEDDDLARRAHKARLKYTTAAQKILAYHLYHPTRSVGSWKHNDGPRVLQNEPWQVRCEHGIANPLPQHEPITETLAP